MTLIRPLLRTVFALGAIACVLPFAACGGGGDDDSGPTGDLSGAIDQRPTVPAEVLEQVIEVKDNSFSPDTITVKAGTKIVWNWVGTSNPHSIQMLGKTSPEQTSGSFERVMDQSGSSITYQCGVHKEAMTARIVIE